MSLFLRLGKNDFIKGLIVAALSTALGAIQPAVAVGTVLDMAVIKRAGWAGAGAGLAYLIKNLFTNSAGQIGPEPPK